MDPEHSRGGGPMETLPHSFLQSQEKCAHHLHRKVGTPIGNTDMYCCSLKYDLHVSMGTLNCLATSSLFNPITYKTMIGSGIL